MWMEPMPRPRHRRHGPTYADAVRAGTQWRSKKTHRVWTVVSSVSRDRLDPILLESEGQERRITQSALIKHYTLEV